MAVGGGALVAALKGNTARDHCSLYGQHIISKSTSNKKRSAVSQTFTGAGQRSRTGDKPYLAVSSPQTPHGETSHTCTGKACTWSTQWYIAHCALKHARCTLVSTLPHRSHAAHSMTLALHSDIRAIDKHSRYLEGSHCTQNMLGLIPNPSHRTTREARMH